MREDLNIRINRRQTKIHMNASRYKFSSLVGYTLYKSSILVQRKKPMMDLNARTEIPTDVRAFLQIESAD